MHLLDFGDPLRTGSFRRDPCWYRGYGSEFVPVVPVEDWGDLPLGNVGDPGLRESQLPVATEGSDGKNIRT